MIVDFRAPSLQELEKKAIQAVFDEFPIIVQAIVPEAYGSADLEISFRTVDGSLYQARLDQFHRMGNPTEYKGFLRRSIKHAMGEAL